MVTEWGMSEKLGPLALRRARTSAALPRAGAAASKDYSEQTAKEIDEEVRRIITEQYGRAREIIDAHPDKLDGIANALLERETLDTRRSTRSWRARPLPERERVRLIRDVRREEERKSSIFQPDRARYRRR